jgi:NitT/TauT family transport system substrate-binding protein
MSRSAPFRGLGLMAAAMLLLAACGSAATTPAPAATAAPPTTAAATPTAAPTELPGTKEFKVAFTSPGLSSAPFFAAIDALNKSGYTIETQVLDQSELVTEGVSNGDFAFGSGANNSVLAAVEKGANLRIVVARVNNEWTMYAANSITDCAGLGGKNLAIHSQGAVSTAMVKNYVQTKCAGTEPNYVVIEGSPNRVAALLANQIDASPLELSDSLTIDAQASDRYHLLASFAADLPDLQTTSVYLNADWAKENPGSAVAMVKAILEQHKKIEGDPAYLQSIAEQFTADAINPDTIEAAAKKYVDLKMFPADGGLTEANVDYTAGFFGPDGTGATKTKIALDQWADLSFLEMALAAIGG